MTTQMSLSPTKVIKALSQRVAPSATLWPWTKDDAPITATPKPKGSVLKNSLHGTGTR